VQHVWDLDTIEALEKESFWALREPIKAGFFVAGFEIGLQLGTRLPIRVCRKIKSRVKRGAPN
jgi:hypothetical protein